jgi:hypothetical protein
MHRRHFILVLLALCVVAPKCLSAKANAKGDPVLTSQLAATIAKVRTSGPPSIGRTNAAEHLAELTRKIDPKAIDDKTVADMVSLLDTSDDSVRLWVAAALGHLGSRAKTAIPKLLNILPEADCLNGMTSAPAIRVALSRMGVTPPPQTKCAVKPVSM